MMDKQTFLIPFPPSVNGYWRSFRGRQIMSKKGRDYRVSIRNCLGLIRPYPKFGDARLAVTMRLVMPSRHRRDIDNDAKAAIDGLKHAGVFDDDEQIDELHIYRESPQRPGYVQVTIEVRQADA